MGVQLRGPAHGLGRGVAGLGQGCPVNAEFHGLWGLVAQVTEIPRELRPLQHPLHWVVEGRERGWGGGSPQKVDCSRVTERKRPGAPGPHVAVLSAIPVISHIWRVPPTTPAHAMCTRIPLEVRGGSGGRLQDPGSGQVAHPLAPCRPPPRLCTASQSSGVGSGVGGVQTPLVLPS